MPKKATKNRTPYYGHNIKQMKVFLSLKEHTVVRTAANLKGMLIRDYMKEAVIEQAKKDTKSFDKIIESV